ncbi:MAG: sugar ABC transporter permease [Anaerolineae bacterium]
MTKQMNDPENALLHSQDQQSLSAYVRSYFQRLASGDLGSMPIIIGIIAIAIIFQFQNSNFLTARNFVNLILQMAGITMIAYGVVFVLLLGEIDLSIGYVSGIGGVAVALLLRDPALGWTWYTAIPAGLLATAAIGLLQGLIITYFQVPSFIVTLAGLLAWNGVVLRMIGGSGTVIIQDDVVRGIAGDFLPAFTTTVNDLTLPIQQRVPMLLDLSFLAPLDVNVAGITISWWVWAILALIGVGLALQLVTRAINYQGSTTRLYLMVYGALLVLALAVAVFNIRVPDVEFVPDDNYRAAIRTVDDRVSELNQDIPHIYNIGRLTLSWGQLTLLAFVAAYAVIQVFAYYNRKSQGLNTRPLPLLAFQVISLSVLALLVAHVSDQDRGVPVVGLILLIFLVVLTFVTNNTQFGRFVYAVGGNPEAARRAGINVRRIRVIVFILSSTLAGMGGIILASRLGSVATNAGGGNILLNSIAAAVIGGTSLFGGRGRISSAVLGALVIASVDNGMGLLDLSSGDKFVITGIVLLVAVIVDSLSLRRQQQSGIA